MFKKAQILFRRLEIQILVFFVSSIFIFLLLGFWANLDNIIANLLKVSSKLLILALVATLFNYFIRFLRFRFLLGKLNIDLKLKPSLYISLSGLAMSVTPGKSGELLKAYFIKQFSAKKVDFSFVAPIVIIERLSDALGTLVLMAWGLWHYQSVRLILILALTGVGLFMVVFTNSWLFDRVYLFLKKISFLDFFTNHIHTFHKGVRRLLQPKILFVSSGLSLISWSGEVLTFAIVYYAISQNMNLHILAVLAFIFTFTSILGFLSFLPGGIGVTEGSKIGLLIWILSLTRTQSVSIVILVRLLTLWLGVLLGLVALFNLIHSKMNYASN